MKYSLILILIFMGGNKAFAQLNIGPKIGINTSVDSYNEFDKLTNLSTSGSHFGLFGRGELLFLFIQPELLYSFNQFSSEVIHDDGSSTFTDYRNNRVDFPIIAGFRFFKLLRIGAGPVFSVITEDNIVGATENPVSFKSSTAGFQLGAGIDIKKIIFDLRYELGVSDFKESMLGIQSDSRPQQLAFSIGIKLF